MRDGCTIILAVKHIFFHIFNEQGVVSFNHIIKNMKKKNALAAEIIMQPSCMLEKGIAAYIQGKVTKGKSKS